MDGMIKNTASGMEKYKTYRVMLSKYNLAMKHGFYLEALLIDYAMLEDRLIAFLWYSGVIHQTDKLHFGTRANKAMLKRIYTDYTRKENTPNLKNISAKIEVLKALIAFAQNPYEDENKYTRLLHEALNTIDLEKLSETLNVIDDWRNYRNEVIHAVMTKNISSLDEELEENAKLGMDYARVIDNAVKKLKNRSAIRKSVRMFNKKEEK